MICVPNHLEKLGTWSERYEGDHDFLASTMRLRGDQPVLHDDVVAEVTPRMTLTEKGVGFWCATP